MSNGEIYWQPSYEKARRVPNKFGGYLVSDMGSTVTLLEARKKAPVKTLAA